MSVKKTTIQYAAIAVIVSLGIVAASFVYIGLPMATGTSTNSSSTSQGGQLAPLAIRLTDPPQVPALTTSLNLTYSSIDLFVGEPSGTEGQLNTTSVAVTPNGGNATIDLLKLQNVSQTIAVANLPNGTILYSVTFNVTAISINVNNTISKVSLATGGSSFEVTIAHPSGFSSGDFALLQLNPVVVNTPSGYQLIPSSVGVMGHGAGSDEVGQQHNLTNSEDNALGSVRGNVSATISSLSVNGNVTSLTVIVNNSASIPVSLAAVGLHGNFTVVGSACATFGSHSSDSQSNQTSSSDNSTSDSSHNPHSFDSNSTSSDSNSTSSDSNSTNFGSNSTGSNDSYHSLDGCSIPEHMNEVVFVPVISSMNTTATSSCATGQLALVNSLDGVSGFHSITISPGQCVQLTFTGELSYGAANFTLVPSISAGQVYVLHVIASNGANQLVGCTLLSGTANCTVQNHQQDSQDW